MGARRRDGERGERKGDMSESGGVEKGNVGRGRERRGGRERGKYIGG